MSIGDRGDYFVKEGGGERHNKSIFLQHDGRHLCFCWWSDDCSQNMFWIKYVTLLVDYSSTVIHECEIKVCCQICDTEEETWLDWAALPNTVQSHVWLFAQVCIIMTSGGAPHKYVGYHVKIMLGGSVFVCKVFLVLDLLNSALALSSVCCIDGCPWGEISLCVTPTESTMSNRIIEHQHIVHM